VFLDLHCLLSVVDEPHLTERYSSKTPINNAANYAKNVAYIYNGRDG
jgi:hypothetical protein